MARSTARKRALNTLYEADEKGQDILSLLDERIAHPGAQTPLPDYAIEIVRGVAEHRRDIDGVLNLRSTSWKVSRMAVVDRNILRIGVWEILFNDDVPDMVAIDEALTLAKSLSDADSPSFIHGLLSAVCSEEKPLREARRAEEEAEAAKAAEAGESSDSSDSAESGESDGETAQEPSEAADSAETQTA
ncbi:transcription antitermination factor NusB [Bifidobacterium avesanii]|uniref:Transcription antitermination protein NusB n=1 Tax=Bifidobacterium avesanii TaxID=1798157 RepID=A0A7K3TF09_9BIFI|nr:transcription antitermination factor NusB [Bifidobacterium avesanii]KAB8295653.1 nitrogen utilization protein B [Bifidobacterium avesanii]NEG77658.1 transcription antitermination factor NusB [Bifidobacterium avesanii]